MINSTVHRKELHEKDDFLSVDHIIEQLRNEGYEITKRTFLYYVQRGLLPKGTRKGYEKGGVQFSYPASTGSLIKIIFELKAKGHSLNGIKELLEALRNYPEGKPHRSASAEKGRKTPRGLFHISPGKRGSIFWTW